MRVWIPILIVMASMTAIAQNGAAPRPVTSQDLLDGLKDGTRWLTYSGDYNGHRHSPLTQITPANVHQLTPQWTFQTGMLGSFQTTPIVLDGRSPRADGAVGATGMTSDDGSGTEVPHEGSSRWCRTWFGWPPAGPVQRLEILPLEIP